MWESRGRLEAGRWSAPSAVGLWGLETAAQQAKGAASWEGSEGEKYYAADRKEGTMTRNKEQLSIPRLSDKGALPDQVDLNLKRQRTDN